LLASYACIRCNHLKWNKMQGWILCRRCKHLQINGKGTHRFYLKSNKYETLCIVLFHLFLFLALEKERPEYRKIFFFLN
jgi:hypothetical protein